MQSLSEEPFVKESKLFAGEHKSVARKCKDSREKTKVLWATAKFHWEFKFFVKCKLHNGIQKFCKWKQSLSGKHKTFAKIQHFAGKCNIF